MPYTRIFMSPRGVTALRVMRVSAGAQRDMCRRAIHSHRILPVLHRNVPPGYRRVPPFVSSSGCCATGRDRGSYRRAKTPPLRAIFFECACGRLCLRALLEPTAPHCDRHPLCTPLLYREHPMSKIALITGVTGQDGSYLAEFLLNKGYEVHGIKRRTSLFNTDRIDHLYQDPHETNIKLTLHYGDLSDSTNLIRIIQQVQPDEIYNLGAMSHVKVSFDTPEYTANADGIGTLRLLEAIRILGLTKKTKIYQASTSELYGLVQAVPQSETTPFYPRSPYAVAKLYAYWITVN